MTRGLSAPPLGPPTRTVVIIGNSAGGGIVDGYPGQYHDVAAAIPVGWSNQGFSPGFDAYAAQAVARGYVAAGDYFRLIPDEESCKKVVLYLPGVLPALTGYCRNGYGGAAPTGEATLLGRLFADNLAAITRVGPGLPVLLVFADHDFVIPPDRAAAEVEYWKAHCGCDVETWAQADAGHAPAVHRTMPTFTNKVVEWLADKGLGTR